MIRRANSTRSMSSERLVSLTKVWVMRVSRDNGKLCVGLAIIPPAMSGRQRARPDSRPELVNVDGQYSRSTGGFLADRLVGSYSNRIAETEFAGKEQCCNDRQPDDRQFHQQHETAG